MCLRQKSKKPQAQGKLAMPGLGSFALGGCPELAGPRTRDHPVQLRRVVVVGVLSWLVQLRFGFGC